MKLGPHLTEEWMKQANCRGMDVDLFFPANNGANYLPFIKEVCQTCDVRQECLDFANENMFEYGMWGGLTPSQRKHYRARTIREGRGGRDSSGRFA